MRRRLSFEHRLLLQAFLIGVPGGLVALLGLLVGLALAPKVNILPLALPLALAYGYRVMDSVDGQGRIDGDTCDLVLGHERVSPVGR